MRKFSRESFNITKAINELMHESGVIVIENAYNLNDIKEAREIVNHFADTQEQKEKTSWHNIVVFGDGLVDIVEKYVKKGSKIYVEGELQTRKWQDKDGNDRYTTEVILQGYNCNLTLLDSRNNNSQISDNSQEIDQSKPVEDNSFGNQSGDSDDLDEDIPF